MSAIFDAATIAEHDRGDQHLDQLDEAVARGRWLHPLGREGMSSTPPQSDQDWTSREEPRDRHHDRLRLKVLSISHRPLASSAHSL
jgi:hypothetical protein